MENKFVVCSRNKISDVVVNHAEFKTQKDAACYIKENFSVISVLNDGGKVVKALGYDCPSKDFIQTDSAYFCQHYDDGEYYIYKLTDLLEVYVEELGV